MNEKILQQATLIKENMHLSKQDHFTHWACEIIASNKSLIENYEREWEQISVSRQLMIRFRSVQARRKITRMKERKRVIEMRRYEKGRKRTNERDRVSRQRKS